MRGGKAHREPDHAKETPMRAIRLEGKTLARRACLPQSQPLARSWKCVDGELRAGITSRRAECAGGVVCRRNEGSTAFGGILHPGSGPR